VQVLAEGHGIAVRSPTSLRAPAAQAEFAALGADAAVVAAYGLILPQAVLEAPRLGCLNVHASLLPRWRGAAPVERAILAGDRETGVTIMQMDAGLDTGPMLVREAVSIGAKETGGSLTERLSSLGARLIVEVLDGIAAGILKPQPQPEAGVTYARKLDRVEAQLDWRGSSAVLERQVRAFDPRPGAFFTMHGERFRVFAAEVLPAAANQLPGMVLDESLAVACGEGALRPLRLQRPGRTPQETAAFLRGYPIPAGTVLPCPAIG
jgi:methionyl-tRNA formyltransferase